MRKTPPAALLSLIALSHLTPYAYAADESKRVEDGARGAGRRARQARPAKDAPVATPGGAPTTPPSAPAADATPKEVRPGAAGVAAALRVECNDGLPSQLCDVVREAALAAAGKSYRIIETTKVEAVLSREPALRSCRREDCRVAISDQLGAAKLIDVTIQTKGRSLTGTVSIYDAAAKGISGDTELQPIKRDEPHIRKAVAEAVDYVIGTQRLTAPLRLNVQPEGALVKIDGVDRGTVREVRLFLGTHQVRVERPQFLPSDSTVNVTPAGAALDVKLVPRPVRIVFKWYPPEARLLVDGDPIDARNPVVDLQPGKHRVQGLAPPGSGYASRDVERDFREDGEVNLPLQPRAELHIQAPLGYTVRVDNQLVSPGKPLSSTMQEILSAADPGSHQVTSTSWRNQERRLVAEAVSGKRTEVLVQPPALWPGMTMAVVGLVAAGAGATMVALDGRCQGDPPGPGIPCQYLLDLWKPGTGLLVGGGALLVGGAVWFAINALDHPRFHHATTTTVGRAGGPSRLRLTLSPYVSAGESGLLGLGRF